MSMENWKRLRNTSGERLPQCRYKTVLIAFRSFNNAVWLVMNDVILGTVLGAFICQNSEVIGISLHNWFKVR
jgi:hypothetical protein